MRQKFVDYPESVHDASQFARAAARSGKDAYFCVHLLTDARRKKECAGQVHAVWADGDGATIPEDFPAPTAVVESSPGRHHYYWRLSSPITAKAAEALNKKLALALGADSSGWDLTQLLRVPGTKNYKYEPPVGVRLNSLDADHAWSEADIVAALPACDRKTEGRGRRTTKQTVAIAPPPVPLEGNDLAIWEHRRVKLPGEKSDRSSQMARLATILRQNGATGEQIVTGLETWDRASGKPKYAGRSDANTRYTELADWATDNVEVRHRSLVRADTHTRGFPLTDMGNAERLAQLYSAELRSVDGQSWTAWDGKRWSKDPATARLVAMKNARALQMEAAAARDDQAPALRAWANRSEGKDRLAAALDVARSLPQLVCRAADFDTRDLELNISTGTLDLVQGIEMPHDPNALHTKLAPVGFNADAACPRFTSFLGETFDSDPDILAYIQRLFGYCLTGKTGEQAFFLLHGRGANGKSTLVRVLLDLLGEYAVQLPPETLLRQQSRSQTNDLARLDGARVAVANELPDGRRLDEALVKQMTGGERISARFLYQEFVEFQPKCKLLISSNYLPEITGTDLGIWRRVHLIPFNRTVPENRRDAHLNEKLRQELPGILNWALAGCLAWQQEGLNPPEIVLAAVEQFREEMDSVGTFIRDTCVEGGKMRTTNGVLWDAFESYCDETGYTLVTKAKFLSELKVRGYKPYRTANTRGFAGISVRGMRRAA